MSDIIKPSDLGYTQFYPVHDIWNAVFVPSNSALNGKFVEGYNILNAVFDSSANALRINISGGSISGDTTIDGDLTVNGDIAYINTTNLNIKDNIILVNSGETGAGVTLGTAGLQVDRGSETDAVILWDEAAGVWKAGIVGTTIDIGASNWNRVGTITELTNAGDNVRIQTLTGSTERILTVSTDVLSASTEVVEAYVSDYGQITGLTSASNWTGKTYGGSVADLEAGQRYIGSDYIYEYDGVTVARAKRYEVGIKTITNEDYTLTQNDDVVLLSSPLTGVTATLPIDVEVGHKYYVKAIDVTEETTLVGSIDGETGYTYATQYKSLTLVHAGSGTYYII